MRIKIDSHAEELLAFSERHHLLAQQIYQLQDHVDGLRADHARLAPGNDSAAALIGQALAQEVVKLDALVWQKREEELVLRKMIQDSKFLGVRAVVDC